MKTERKHELLRLLDMNWYDFFKELPKLQANIAELRFLLNHERTNENRKSFLTKLHENLTNLVITQYRQELFNERQELIKGARK